MEDPEAELGRWTMEERFPLPKSLNECVQDCELPGIKVRHKMKFIVQLHNPDGHISELRASLPVTLFISPNHLMNNETNSIPTDIEYTETPDDLIRAPPCYNDHYLDALYSHFPTDTFESPFASGANTPLVLSRNNSVENLAAALHRALGSPSSSRHSTISAANGRSGHTTAHHSDDDDDESRRLAQVPSYDTAVRSRPPSRGDEAPGYEEGGSPMMLGNRGRTATGRSMRSLNGMLGGRNGTERDRTPVAEGERRNGGETDRRSTSSGEH